MLLSLTFSFEDPRDNDEYLWGVCRFVIEAGYHVARLYAAAFEIPRGEWTTELEAFKADLDETNKALQKSFGKSPPN